MAKVIAVINEKGGVGKTTSVNVMASVLKKLGYSVLCVDFDPQAHLTFGFGGDNRTQPTVYDVIKRKSKIKQTIQTTNVTDLLPSNDMLKSLEGEFTNIGSEQLLKRAIHNMRRYYDFILVDSPPELGLLSINAITAADVIFVPCLPDGYSMMGAIKVHETISKVREAFNPELTFGGVFLIQYFPRQKLSVSIGELLDDLSQRLHVPRIGTRIRHSSSISDAVTVQQLDVAREASDNMVVQDYTTLVLEFFERGIL